MATPASAHRWPPQCLTNGIDITHDKSRQVVRNGDVITYDLWIQNTKNAACDVTGAALQLYLPTATGAAGATPLSLAPGNTYAGGFPFTKIVSYDYTVAVNAGVDSVTAESGIAGVLHDIPQDRSFAVIQKSLATEVTQPSISIDKVGSIQAGQAPQNVRYTYYVTNVSSTPVPMDRLVLTDDKCVGPTLAANGDGDAVLANGETWVYFCDMLHQAPGVYTNTASVCAYSRVPGDTDRPVCSPPDTWTVTLTPPPPQVAVQPAAARQEPCRLSTPKRLRVRAGEMNTIRVRTRSIDAGTLVRITLPGGRVLRDRTDRNGVAVFRVRPPRSGRARIKAAECADVERLSVRQARRTESRRVPRVTG